MASELTSEQRETLAQAVRSGRKIEAIKELRDWTGLGLKEAKDIVDRMESDLRAAHPEQFAQPRKTNGLVTVIAVLIFFTATALAVYFFFH